MLNKFSGNAQLAKAMAMYGKRLTPDDYTELLRKRSVGEIAGYLKSTSAYGETLKSLNESSIHRGLLEMLLQREMYARYERLSGYDTATGGGFFGYIVRLGEIDEILRLIMYLNAEDPEGFIADIPAFIVKHASFDLMSLAEVKDFSELIETLSGTPYAAVLKSQLTGGSETVDYTACEAALYTYIYLDEIAKIKKCYRGKTRALLTELLKADIELKNISTIYRARVFFGKSEEQVREILFPVWNKLHKESQNQLIEAESADDFYRRLRATHYGKYMDKDGVSDIDLFARQVKYLADKQAMRFSADPPSALYAFVSLCTIELFNITNIIEGVRYGVSAADIHKLLITD